MKYFSGNDRNLKYDITGHRHRNFNRSSSNYCNLYYLRDYPMVEMAPAAALIADFMFLAVQRPYHA